MNDFKSNFITTEGCYLLTHSVGRPLKSVDTAITKKFLDPWANNATEPWGDWLDIISDFTQQLATLFNSYANLFCPQVNLSSALTKVVMSHQAFNHKQCVILMSASDFPSMGYVFQQALPYAELRFIPDHVDITKFEQWEPYITDDVSCVFISHVYSNTGQLAPVTNLLPYLKSKNVMSILDVAQSAGIIPLDLNECSPDFLIGSSVKWLSGSSGAAFLWVSPQVLPDCKPKDVGWFSHDKPFEMDIKHFKYHKTALKYWGGTPSILPYVVAANSLAYFNKLTIDVVRKHNLSLTNLLIEAFEKYLVSPKIPSLRSGTVILNFDHTTKTANNKAIAKALMENDIAVDSRSKGIRVSPSLVNEVEDIEKFIAVVCKQLGNEEP